MDGTVCRSKNCHICCLDTAMQLTSRDASRLQGAGHSGFMTEEGILRNIDGRCIFLDVLGLCTIYSIRPEGCRSYPLTMRLPQREIVLDGDCPNRSLFRPTPEDLIALEDIVSRLEAEM